MHIKPSKLFVTLDQNMGKQKNFTITTKGVNIKISGELHKYDHQYCFTKGAAKVVIEQAKVGSVWSWKGTYHAYVVKFMATDNVLAEFEIPPKAKLTLEEIK